MANCAPLVWDRRVSRDARRRRRLRTIRRFPEPAVHRGLVRLFVRHGLDLLNDDRLDELLCFLIEQRTINRYAIAALGLEEAE